MKPLISFLAAALAAASLAAQEAAPALRRPPPAATRRPTAGGAGGAPPDVPAPRPPRARTDAAIKQAYQTLRRAGHRADRGARRSGGALRRARADRGGIRRHRARARALRVSGVRVSPDGLVLIRDPNLPLRRYGEITALDASGVSLPMRISAVLENHAAILLEPVKPQPPKPCVTFEPADIKAGDRILIGELAFMEDALALDVDETFASAIAVEAEAKLTQAIWWQAPLPRCARERHAHDRPADLRRPRPPHRHRPGQQPLAHSRRHRLLDRDANHGRRAPDPDALEADKQETPRARSNRA